MKISFNWLSQYINISQSPDEVAHLLTHSGLEVEGVEAHESLPGGLKNFVIGQVMTCEKHPNADKLTKTTVDVGNGKVLPIVCGAPNVAAGQKVIVALVGAEIRMEGKEPFAIQKAKVRGEVSEGMICAEDELGIGHSHEGILVLNTDLPTGTLAADYFNVEVDHVLEIGLTPNRADAASHFGVARELKALLKQDLLVNPNEYPFKGTFASPMKATIENKEACPRYAGVYVRGVEIKPSPEWLQKALKTIGLSPINNVVDATNYVLHGLGQPLHAFDAEQLTGSKIIVKTAEPITTFITLDGKERKLNEYDLVIADAEKPACIAGVFGGKDSGVSASTKNIFIESAYFNPDFVRKTAQRLAIKTDSSFRFERGTNPEMVVPALKFAANLIREIAGGELSELIDIYQNPVLPFEVVLKWNRLNKLIGEELPRERVKEILGLLEISIVQEDAETLYLRVPAYRVDVQREADVVEEILRVYGYNNIHTKPYLSTEFLASFPERDTDKTKQNLGRLLVAKGFSEIYTNSLTSIANVIEENSAVKILNALSSELDVMRQSLLPSALETVAHNINRKQKEVKVFELGYVYQMAEKGPKYRETQQLSIVISGAQESESWKQKTQPVSFYDLKNAVAVTLAQLGINNFSLKKTEQKWMSNCVEIVAQNKTIGVFGQISKPALKAFDCKQDVFAAEINLDLVFALKQKALAYKDLSKFPEVRRDLSLILDKKVKYQEIEACIKTFPLIKEVNLFDVFEGESLGKEKKSYAVSFVLLDETKTLEDNVISATFAQIILALESKFEAKIIGSEELLQKASV
jgi:phenylalanyl-tRNA synthetase beta chain